MGTGTLRRYHALRHTQTVVDETPTHFVQPTTPPPVAVETVEMPAVTVTNAEPTKKSKSK